MRMLFNSGESTCMGTLKNNKAVPVSKLVVWRPEYISINPLKPGTARGANNVTAFRNFLIETDEDINGNKVSIEQQAISMFESKMPWSTCTKSGNKSLHFIICLNECLGDKTIYTAYFKAIQKALLKNYNIVVDQKCKDAARFTRAPFGINTKPELVELKPNPEDRVQKLIRITRRYSRAELDQWLKDNIVDWREFLPKPRPQLVTNNSADNQEKIDWVMKYYMKNQKYEKGNRHNYQLVLAYCLLRTGMSPDDIDAYINSHFPDGISTGIITVHNLVESCTGDPINVPSKQDRKAYIKAKEETERMELYKKISKPHGTN